MGQGIFEIFSEPLDCPLNALPGGIVGDAEPSTCLHLGQSHDQDRQQELGVGLQERKQSLSEQSELGVSREPRTDGERRALQLPIRPRRPWPGLP
jgi:hypothetical protein